MNCPTCQAPVDPAQNACPKCGPLPSAQIAQAEGNPALAFGGGMVGALLGAAVWWVTAIHLNIKIGFVAWGVGIAAGMGVVMLGRGRGPTFQLIGAVTAVLGLVIGEFMIYRSIVGTENSPVSQEELDEPQDPQTFTFVEYLKADFSPIDILFVILAVLTGWRIPGAGAEQEPAAT